MSWFAIWNGPKCWQVNKSISYWTWQVSNFTLACLKKKKEERDTLRPGHHTLTLLYYSTEPMRFFGSHKVPILEYLSLEMSGAANPVHCTNLVKKKKENMEPITPNPWQSCWQKICFFFLFSFFFLREKIVLRILRNIFNYILTYQDFFYIYKRNSSMFLQNFIYNLKWIAVNRVFFLILITQTGIRYISNSLSFLFILGRSMKS